MITRHQAAKQADACFAYNAAAFAVTTVGLALSGSRVASTLIGAWALGLATHAALLYGVPQSRERILMWTASGMEERQRLQEQVAT